MPSYTDLSRDEHTEYIYDLTCFGEPVFPETAEDVAEGIKRAVELDERPAFLEGLTARLNKLGVPCTPKDTEIILAEVRERYKSVLGKTCPRTVVEWVRGTTPGVTNRRNNYELCYALGMGFEETAVFFQKHFLTLPWCCKSRIDAVFLYCLYHKRSYSDAAKMLDESQGLVPQENARTATSQIFRRILETDNDEEFLRYLSAHCYGSEQQFMLAKELIIKELAEAKDSIINSGRFENISPERLNSLTISELLGYRYQLDTKGIPINELPKRFTESLPNDVTLGRIINGQSVSYELLRKTLMLLKFYNFYTAAGLTDDPTEIAGNLMDFCDELNKDLTDCGFAQLYLRHPFDCLLLYCANSNDPILTMHLLNERN